MIAEEQLPTVGPIKNLPLVHVPYVFSSYHRPPTAHRMIDREQQSNQPAVVAATESS